MSSSYNSRSMNTTNGTSSFPPSSSTTAQPAGTGLKSFFKTPEGRFKLQYEKTYPYGLLHYSHGKTVTQVTIAQLRDKQTATETVSASGFSVASGVKSAAARFLSGANGRTISNLVGGNGGNKYGSSGSGNGRVGSWCASASGNLSNSWTFDGKGRFLIFNVGEAVFISDLESIDKDPIKLINFSSSHPVCHAFDPDVQDGHDLLIGLNSGDVYSVSLRQQLQDQGKKLVGAQHYNRDGTVNNSSCTSIAWVPNGEGAFVVAHADGNMYVYEKQKDSAGDSWFPIVKDQTRFSIAHGRAKSNPITRWHICQGSINRIAFSNDGTYLATVGRDGYLRVFDFRKEQLVCGVKGYYGALLCCAWSGDAKYIVTGGEDDLVQVWSMEDRQVIARGEGHNSWVSAVAFDTYWSSQNPDESTESTIYRFGSVGQDARLLIWDLELDELVIPQLRHATSGSPTLSSRSHSSSHWDNAYPVPVGTLQAAPSMRDIPKLSPLVAQRVHNEPLSGLIFTQDSVLTACCEGRIKVWVRPTDADNQSANSDKALTSDKLCFSPRGSCIYRKDTSS